MDIISIVFKSMNFENFEAQISLRDKVNREKYIGSDENWERAERAIVEACEEKGLKAKVEYGEAAFYGPKLDFMVKDAIGRRWQLGTIQVDYNLPERFQLEYMGSDNQKHRPVMIHRAPFGSMERFVAVLIEHTAGKFPLWLTPDQVAILPISEKFNDYANQVRLELKKSDIRAIVDDRNEKIGRKIRDNEMKRIPYMLIVGEKEAENGEVAVRKQVVVLPVSEKSNDYARKVAEILNNQNVRAIVDDRNEKIGRKIRDNELKRIPYMLIVGEKEAEQGLVSVRQQGAEEKGQMTVQEFADFINRTVEEQMNAF